MSYIAIEEVNNFNDKFDFIFFNFFNVNSVEYVIFLNKDRCKSKGKKN